MTLEFYFEQVTSTNVKIKNDAMLIMTNDALLRSTIYAPTLLNGFALLKSIAAFLLYYYATYIFKNMISKSCVEKTNKEKNWQAC